MTHRPGISISFQLFTGNLSTLLRMDLTLGVVFSIDMELGMSNSHGTFAGSPELLELSRRYGGPRSCSSHLVSLKLHDSSSKHTDGINISLPLPSAELEGPRSKPWPHVDQSPNRRFKHCIQGIANLVSVLIKSNV